MCVVHVQHCNLWHTPKKLFFRRCCWYLFGWFSFHIFRCSSVVVSQNFSLSKACNDTIVTIWRYIYIESWAVGSYCSFFHMEDMPFNLISFWKVWDVCLIKRWWATFFLLATRAFFKVGNMGRIINSFSQLLGLA